MSPLPRPPPNTALRGSLTSFPLGDVLVLLAATVATGALEVFGDGRLACLFLDKGAVVAAQSHGGDDALDVVVELLRMEEGDFTFDPAVTTDHSGPPLAVPGLLADARDRLDEWQAIEAALPSGDHLVVLAPTVPTDRVVLTRDQWRAVAAIGAGTPVGLLVERLADDELGALRLLKGLVDAGLVDVLGPVHERADSIDGEFDCDDDEDDEVEEDAGEQLEPPSRIQAPMPQDVAPVIVVRAERAPPWVSDPALEARLTTLTEQLDFAYGAGPPATVDEAGGPGPRPGLFAKLRQRRDR